MCSILSKINVLRLDWITALGTVAGDGAIRRMPRRPSNSSIEVLNMNAIMRNLKMSVRGAALDVPVRVFWPIEDKGGWDCRWEIVWPDRQRTNSGRGSDAIQALLNALQMVGTEIYCSEEHRSGKLSWNDNWSGYGFPGPRQHPRFAGRG
jgi:hypothetical protein